jgi:hypothetical protein
MIPDRLSPPECPIADVPDDTGRVAQPRRDDRKSSRTAVPRERQACELRYGPEVFAGLLADRSNKGFGVFVDRIDHLAIGKKVKLQTDQGTFTARIVYINKVAGPQNVESASGSWYRLGLKTVSGFFFL